MAESGIVKWLTHDKGFGFIAVDGGLDVYFGHDSVAGSGFFALSEGDQVEFERADDMDKPRARIVIRFGEGPLPDFPPPPPDAPGGPPPRRTRVRTPRRKG